MNKKSYVNIAFLLLVFSLFMFVYTWSKFSLGITGVIRSDVSFEQDDLFDCGNLSLKEFCYCIVNSVKPYYNYTVNYSVSTPEYILENGGDCTEWTSLYKLLSEKYGFNHTDVYIPTHVFSVITDVNNTGYCVVDALNVNYYKFGSFE